MKIKLAFLALICASASFAASAQTPVSSSMPELNPYDYYLDFNELDANGDQLLTRKEIKEYMGCGCSDASRANLLREFRVMDQSRDGRLNRDELGSWLTLE